MGHMGHMGHGAHHATRDVQHAACSVAIAGGHGPWALGHDPRSPNDTAASRSSVPDQAAAT
eukprot:8710754-Alexandrium_andersonii.AAC.1